MRRVSTLEDAVAGLRLWPHHVETLRRTVDRFSADPSVRAVILGGSLAHGFGGEGADVDVVVVVSPEELARRTRTLELTHATHDLATYPGGYVDAKFVDLDFLRDVAARGSDPARWAFDGVRVLLSREPALLAEHRTEHVDALVAAVLGHFGHDEAELERTWGTRFLLDTELTWQRGRPPVDEL